MVPAYDLHHVHRGMISIIPLCVRPRSMEPTRYVCCKSIILYFYLQHHHIMTLAQQQSKLDASNLSIAIFTWLRALMSMHFYSYRQLLDLQVQRFVEQQQVSLKWITQGLSNIGRKWSKVFPLKQPCNQDTRSLLCPQHTQYRCTSSAKR